MNPPFSYRWEPGEAMAEDMRFKSHGVAPKSAAEFAFLLHGLHYLKEDGGNAGSGIRCDFANLKQYNTTGGPK